MNRLLKILTEYLLSSHQVFRRKKLAPKEKLNCFLMPKIQNSNEKINIKILLGFHDNKGNDHSKREQNDMGLKQRKLPLKFNSFKFK